MVTRALARGLEVLEVLAAAPEGGVGLSAIADQLGLDKATVTRLLQTLVATDYATRDESTRRYRMTSKLLRLSRGGTYQLNLPRLARPHLERLRNSLGETVHLGVMEGVAVIYLDKLESTNSIQLVSAIGQAMPLHSTSLGKAILAGMAEPELEAKLAQMDFAPRTERTIRDRAEFRNELRRIQKIGYATDDRENEPLGACVAAVIVGRNGSPAGAISVAGPDFRIRPRFEEIGVKCAPPPPRSSDLGVVSAEEGE
jgi:DNA-binding IclR family transcriptional regulator